MNGEFGGRSESFSTGATETKYPTVQPTPFRPSSVFDESAVHGSTNGLSSSDFNLRRIGGSGMPSVNGASSATYNQRLWLDKNPYRSLSG